MSSYRTLLAQYDQLKFEIEREIQAESDRVAELVATRVREVLEAFGFEMDVVPRKRHVSAETKKRNVLPKYWNPKTGQTWSGRGRTPHWIAGKDREQYLIGAVVDEGASRHAGSEPVDRIGATNACRELDRPDDNRPHPVDRAASPNSGSGARDADPPLPNPVRPTHDD